MCHFQLKFDAWTNQAGLAHSDAHPDMLDSMDNEARFNKLVELQAKFEADCDQLSNTTYV